MRFERARRRHTRGSRIATKSRKETNPGGCHPHWQPTHNPPPPPHSYNTWQMMEAAAGVKGTPDDVKNQLDKAAANGLNVVRSFAFGTTEGFGLQTKPGEYNEKAFKALDFMIDEAGKRGLKLILAIANNWDDANTDEKRRAGANTDNKFAYANAAGKLAISNGRVVGEGAFFTDPGAKKLYKNHLEALANRVNSINGKKYKDDPAIMAWNLINEPRCESPVGCGMQEWVAEMAPYMKQVDPNHLVTIGADGFYSAASCLADKYNPFLWAGYTGECWWWGCGEARFVLEQFFFFLTNTLPHPPTLNSGNDFLPAHAVNGIDYAAIHLWPDNWQRWDPGFGKAWIDGHVEGARLLGKPLLLEEFGKGVGGKAVGGEDDRTKWFNQTYTQARESIANRDALKGILFWRWAALGNNGGELSDFDKSASITVDSPAFRDVVKPFGEYVATRNDKVCGGGGGRKASPPTAARKNATAPTAAVETASAATGRRLQGAGPGPDFFKVPVPEDAGAGCNAAYGRVDAGEVTKTVTAKSVADCCAAAKSAAAAAWSYCYCDGGCTDATNATVAKGGCQFRAVPHPYYTPTLAMGAGVGWISGAPGAVSVLPAFKCQLKGAGACGADADPATCSSADLKKSVVCADDTCSAEQKNVDGNLIVFDINSAAPTPTILTAADCCAACKADSACTAWTFCPLKDGCAKDCPTYIASASPGKGFGPYGKCQGDAFPYRACSLKAMPGGKHTTTASGPHQPWVSGVVRKKGA